MTLRHHHAKCYYCICTVCNSRRCPWQRKQLGACYNCSEEKGIRPRLECDFFHHYLKSKRYTFRRVGRDVITLYNVFCNGEILFKDVTYSRSLYLSSVIKGAQVKPSKTVAKNRKD